MSQTLSSLWQTVVSNSCEHRLSRQPAGFEVLAESPSKANAKQRSQLWLSEWLTALSGI